MYQVVQAAVPKVLLSCGFALYFTLYISLLALVFGLYLLTFVGCKYFIAVI
jgi:hypothetical protein